MSARATNVALKDTRNETAILALLHHGMVQTPGHASNPLDQWHAITKRVAQSESLSFFYGESRHVDQGRTYLNATMAEIDALTVLQQDWNDEGAPAIDRAAILFARGFVQRLACVAAVQNLTGDCGPTVFPTIDGGLKLSWKTHGHQVALVFHPGQSFIEIVEKSPGVMAFHRSVSESEAGDVALEAMRETL